MLLRSWMITGSLRVDPRLGQTHPPTGLTFSVAPFPSQPRTAQKLSSLKETDSKSKERKTELPYLVFSPNSPIRQV